ncbi:uncharacterized protein LOC121799240 isoform X2 [Salvia splendens]|uniref:uncharacterized protein LOC121799240 isoform X2 n=1 Tax=Salvia splendens TaxID=180675 RepID=UPI001C263F1B|nr:uncharacterized protein LOC121799240 isoform X2 [Salvia splendens]
MAKKLVNRWKKKPAKRISKRRKLKSALKMIFNYMKSDDYMFAPLISPQSTPSPSPVSPDEVSMDEKLVEDYLKCDAYMYAPLVVDQGTTIPSSGTKGIVTSPRDVLRRRWIVVDHSLLQSERVKHVHREGEELSQKAEQTENGGSYIAHFVHP